MVRLCSSLGTPSSSNYVDDVIWCACLVRVMLEAATKYSIVPDDATFASQIALVEPLSCSKVPIDLSDASSILSPPNTITNLSPP